MTKEGLMALTRMLCFPKSTAICRVRIDTAPFEAQYAERRAAFRDLRHVTVRDAGHMLHHDQPEQVARLMEEFLLA